MYNPTTTTSTLLKSSKLKLTAFLITI